MPPRQLRALPAGGLSGSLREVRDEVCQQLRRRVLLEHVAGAFDPPQLGVRDPVVQPAPVLGRQDSVFGAPDQAGGDRDLAQQVLVLGRVRLLDLAVLAIDRSSP